MSRRVKPLGIVAALIIAGLSGCTGLHLPAPQEDVWRSAEPPPPSWEAAISFMLADSTRVEFFDGRRTRVVHAREQLPERLGASAYYRVRPRDTFSTTIHVTADFPGQGTVTAEYPLNVKRGEFYTVRAYPSSRNPERVLISAREARSYPIPVAARREPSDSLWVFWTAQTRECWNCPR
jgi:hypothetical protein